MKKGFSLLEVLIYSAMAAVLMIAMSSSLISLNKAFQNIRADFSINQNLSEIVGVLSTEVRRATSVDSVNSQFGVGGGKLFLNSIDSSGINSKSNFVLQNGVLYYQKGSSSSVALNSDKIFLKKFDVYSLSSSHSYAVKIDFSFDYLKNGATTTQNISNMYILRGSY